MRQTLRPLIAEFIGVFFLVFAGVGAVVANTYRENSLGLLGIAAAHGLALAVAISATMSISGGHINPAVTVGLWSVGRIAARQAGLYVVAQLLGALAAAFAVKELFPEMAGTVAQLGTPRLAEPIGLAEGVLIEAILTFFLGFAVMGTAVDPRAPRIGGFAIGLTVMLGILAAGDVTGAAMNPARAFGPAVAANAWLGQIVYWVGPILGAVAAMQIYERLLMEKRG